MVLSKTKIANRAKKKTNSELVETIIRLKKNNQELASLIAIPTRKRIEKNLNEINKAKSDSVIVPGKILGSGEIEGKKKIVGLSFSSSAEEKLKKKKIEFTTIIKELEKNKDKKIEGEILK